MHSNIKHELQIRNMDELSFEESQEEAQRAVDDEIKRSIGYPTY